MTKIDFPMKIDFEMKSEGGFFFCSFEKLIAHKNEVRKIIRGNECSAFFFFYIGRMIEIGKTNVSNLCYNIGWLLTVLKQFSYS